MRLTVTGASGLIGSALVARLSARGDEVTVLTRAPERARAALQVQAVAWDLSSEAAPAEALEGRDAVIHLAGENIAQRWSAGAKRAIRDSRLTGTSNLLAGLQEIDTAAGEVRPRVLVSSSAIGYYGPHGEEPLDEDAPAGEGFLAQTCAEWEARAERARELQMRVVQIRTGVVLARGGGALAKMLLPFRLGLGGPIAGGEQYMSWIHLDDLIEMLLTAVGQEDWSGPVNATAPEPVSNDEFSRVLAGILHRPALMAIPAFALRALYGEMAQVLTSGARVLPAKALVLGYEFRHPHLSEALRSTIG